MRVRPSSRGWRKRERPRVRTTRLPFEAKTAPVTIRSPLPSAPRVGMRTCLEDRKGRARENSAAISSSLPGRPGPSSSTKMPAVPNSPNRQEWPVSKALSANSLTTNRGISFSGTFARCTKVSKFKNSRHSSLRVNSIVNLSGEPISQIVFFCTFCQL